MKIVFLLMAFLGEYEVTPAWTNGYPAHVYEDQQVCTDAAEELQKLTDNSRSNHFVEYRCVPFYKK